MHMHGIIEYGVTSCFVVQYVYCMPAYTTLLFTLCVVRLASEEGGRIARLLLQPGGEGRGGGGRGPGLGARKEGGRGSLREGEAGDLSAEANLGHRRHFQHALLMVLRVLNS